MKNIRLISLFFLIVGGGLFAQEINKFPLYKKPNEPVLRDWLIDNSGFKAEIYRTKDNNSLILDNGLVRRTFRVSPNLATVDLCDLSDGQSLLRAIRPEALLTLNGLDFEVGGLSGQPNQAFILDKWIEQMSTNPVAFQFSYFSVGKIKKRLEWKKVRLYDKYANWPPKGISLSLHFKLPPIDDTFVKSYLTHTDNNKSDALLVLPSTYARTQILYEDFERPSKNWHIHTSTSHERSSFNNEGKGGEIYTPENSVVYSETHLPSSVALVQATVFAGTDSSLDHGPGIAAIFENGSVVKFYIRSKKSSNGEKTSMLGLFDGKKTYDDTKTNNLLDFSKPLVLRIRSENGKLFFDSKEKDGHWRNNYIIIKPPLQGEMIKARVGKMDAKGGNVERRDLGELVRLKIEDFAAFSKLDYSQTQKIAEQLKKLQNVEISIIYDLYDGLPLFSKRLEVHNRGEENITVDKFTSEVLAMVEKESVVGYTPEIGIEPPDRLHVETDYAFGGMEQKNANRHVVHWDTDSLYTSQVCYDLKAPCLLKVEPSVGPSQDVAPNSSFKSFTTFELIHNSSDRERRGLAVKQMYRTVSPWVAENPLMMHCVSVDPQVLRTAIDQCAEVGFEVLIISFGSGFNMENSDPEDLKKWKELADYAHSKHVEIGGYSLLASRKIGGGNDVVSPKGTSPMFGSCPALTSTWGIEYYRKIRNFFDQTGFSLLEHDGPYPGDIDITPRPPLQKGELDSRWVQWRLTDSLYKNLRADGVYMNTPDWYYHNGANKTSMGYREVNWSLPRAEQVIHTRQNTYDGTWEKTPSMGWMFLPLTEYHGGGEAATVEPLYKHIDHYERMLYSNLAMGVQPMCRGYRLYDTIQTKTMVKKWVDWYKQYRDILESDIVHGVRANGRDIDWMLHVNPKLENKGMLVVFNPLSEPVEKTIKLPLYYAGLKSSVRIIDMSGRTSIVELGGEKSALIKVKVAPEGMSWYLIKN